MMFIKFLIIGSASLSFTALAGYTVDDDIVPPIQNRILVGCQLFNTNYSRNENTPSGFDEFTYTSDNAGLMQSNPYDFNASSLSTTFSFVYSGQKNSLNNGWLDRSNKWRIITDRKDIGSTTTPQRCLAHTPSKLLRFDTCNVPSGKFDNVSWQSRDFFLRNTTAGPDDTRIFTDSSHVVRADFFNTISAKETSALGAGVDWIIRSCKNKWGQPVNPAAYSRYFDRGDGAGPN